MSLFLRRTLVACTVAAYCVALVAPVGAKTAEGVGVSTESPYTGATIGWTVPVLQPSEGMVQDRSVTAGDDVESPLDSYSFESVILEDGAQTLIYINSAEAPTRYVFPIELGADDRLELMDDGTVSLNSGRFPQGAFEKPWARDANGVDIPTHFEVDGDNLVQVVEFGSDTSFPVVVDPRFNWGIASGHVYLNKSETRAAAAIAGGGGLAALPWLALVPPPFSLVVGSNTLSIGVWATAALALDKCLALKFGATGKLIPPAIGVSPEHHTGSDCY